MVELSPEFIARSRTVFQGAQPTLEDVRQNILALDASTRRRDAVSALQAIMTLYKIELAATPATFPALRRIFTSKNAAELAISPKRFANIRSEIFRAVREFGTPSPNLTRGPELTADWQVLLEKVQNRNYRASLSRLARYCSAMAIPPSEVGPEALLGLFEALQAEGGVKDPRVILQHVTAYWNYHEKRVPDWPRLRLKTPFATNRYLLSLSDLSSELKNDIIFWQQKRMGGDLLSLDRIAHKSRLVTVQHQTAQILRYLGLLASNGLIDVRTLHSLTDIVQPELVQAAAKVLLNQRNRSAGYVHSFVYVLLGIARHETNLPQEKIERLARLAKNLRHETKKGMTKRNRTLLRQFDDPENIKKLMGYSTDERQRGAEELNPYRQAKYYERALIADLLLHGALRIKNIVMLRMDQNMRKRGSAYILTYTAEEMKTHRSHEIQLPDWMTEHVEEFRSRYRPHLLGQQGPYLIPGGVNDGTRHHSAIREEFKHHIYRHLGLRVHPHFMRHLSSKLILDADPAQLKTVSNRLGHTTTETAQITYLETDSLSASRKANSILSRLHKNTSTKHRRR